MAQIQEPPSAYAAEYPYNNVVQTESGHFQEFDDTPGAERIRTQHRAGTYTEIRPDGSEVHKIVFINFVIAKVFRGNLMGFAPLITSSWIPSNIIDSNLHLFLNQRFVYQ